MLFSVHYAVALNQQLLVIDLFSFDHLSNIEYKLSIYSSFIDSPVYVRHCVES